MDDYGHHHRALRAQWSTVVRSGRATCTRCRLPIGPGDAWDLDHTDDRTSYRGPSHQSCNRAHGADLTNSQRRRTANSRPL